MRRFPRPRLILICGLPGAGKTTLARRVAAQLPAVRLCPDEWMAQLEVDPFDGPFDPVELRYLRIEPDQLWRLVQRRNASEDKFAVQLDQRQPERYAQRFEAPDDAEMSLFDEHFEVG